jgi:putative transposase
MLEALSRGREMELYDLWAYAVMPEHVHIVLLPRPETTISKILKTIKQSVSRHALLWLAANDPEFLPRLEVFDRSGMHKSYQFWQRGGGYDRNLRSVSDVHEKISYVHNNPVRRGLVEKPAQWLWSSAAAWETGRDEPIAIDRSTVPRLVESGI